MINAGRHMLEFIDYLRTWAVKHENEIRIKKNKKKLEPLAKKLEKSAETLFESKQEFNHSVHDIPNHLGQNKYIKADYQKTLNKQAYGIRDQVSRTQKSMLAIINAMDDISPITDDHGKPIDENELKADLFKTSNEKDKIYADIISLLKNPVKNGSDECLQLTSSADESLNVWRDVYNQTAELKTRIKNVQVNSN
ncbi:hypothetical protein CCAX7_21180 [Capsulimonas corticalis]|uniref:Uncharacterized protein n=1 Tax=Capsulimonas corticalis TaxID=2219043 RepID=A0A9N7L255_9BACT|nr:hypothetical protein CCAX7_21180 [Capsulimonas corticalis]